MNVPVTVGGIFVGLSILVWHGLRWWKANGKKKDKDWKALLPLGYGIALGILGAACAGGVLGTIFGWVRGGSSGAGDKVINGATGTTASRAASATLPALTPGGALIVACCFVALIALWKKITVDDRRQIIGGSISGSTLGTSAGVAGTGALALIPLINSVGDSIVSQI